MRQSTTTGPTGTFAICEYCTRLRLGRDWVLDISPRATMMSTGVISDNQTMFNEARDYFYNGSGNGAINKTIWILYDDGTGQVQEVNAPMSPFHGY